MILNSPTEEQPGFLKHVSKPAVHRSQQKKERKKEVSPPPSFLVFLKQETCSVHVSNISREMSLRVMYGQT